MENQIKVTVEYKRESISKFFDTPVSVQAVLTESSVKSALGYDDNVSAQDEEGFTLDGTHILSDGDTIYVAKRAGEKQ
jgi:hypothetical protein